jgi:peroxiredoxin
MDQEIEKLSDLPDEVRARAIRDLVVRIRQQPKAYAVALAYNLAIAAAEATERDTLQEVTTTLVDAVQKSPNEYRNDSEYTMLAKLARYYHMQVTLDDPRYEAEISKLQADDQHRSAADFTLTDVQGREWNLSSLRGKVVLVNFWATWCPPCRRELPDLGLLYERFRDRGFVILAVTDEEVSKVKPFLSQQKVSYPVLLDPGHKVKDLFGIDGIPQTLVYDREGHLVAQAIDRPAMHGFLDMLAQAGLQ